MYARFHRFLVLQKNNVGRLQRRGCKSVSNDSELVPGSDEFRVLALYPPIEGRKKRTRDSLIHRKQLPPREKRMQIRHDWPSVWPTAQTYRPSVVPLPLYQGYVEKKAPPGKYANAELMKIPNFLHLAPPAVKRHCAAIKKFCTEWPKELVDDEKSEKHFPIEVITSSYCHSAPTILDERARVVTLKIRLDHLNLDYHARDKMIKLVGKDRFNAKTNTLVLVADRCPLKNQNYDFLIYVLAALYRESQIIEPWESEMMEEDQLDFFFEGSRHQKRIIETVKSVHLVESSEAADGNVEKDAEKIKEYGLSVERIINDGEDEESMQLYKKSVSEILKLSS